ncbi:MAG: hypothetical protein Solumvirus2_55 [Solumvirus sp.]|uniref:Uncharacterized protein n=1 Tax=Solumvirus sp. TaxID=2487773 RepID=A0A3G5AGI7_9VIRU|nr:MAG: hypothetical protein Solumvirus2_55 [Solumvirus sp.]
MSITRDCYFTCNCVATKDVSFVTAEAVSPYFDEKGIIEIILGYDIECFREAKINQFLINKKLEKWLPTYLWTDYISMIISIMKQIKNSSNLTEIELEEKFRRCSRRKYSSVDIHLGVKDLRQLISEVMNYF